VESVHLILRKVQLFGDFRPWPGGDSIELQDELAKPVLLPLIQDLTEWHRRPAHQSTPSLASSLSASLSTSLPAPLSLTSWSSGSRAKRHDLLDLIFGEAQLLLNRGHVDEDHGSHRGTHRGPLTKLSTGSTGILSGGRSHRTALAPRGSDDARDTHRGQTSQHGSVHLFLLRGGLSFLAALECIKGFGDEELVRLGTLSRLKEVDGCLCPFAFFALDAEDCFHRFGHFSRKSQAQSCAAFGSVATLLNPKEPCSDPAKL
jgi:hypothetical protein